MPSRARGRARSMRRSFAVRRLVDAGRLRTWNSSSNVAGVGTTVARGVCGGSESALQSSLPKRLPDHATGPAPRRPDGPPPGATRRRSRRHLTDAGSNTGRAFGHPPWSRRRALPGARCPRRRARGSRAFGSRDRAGACRDHPWISRDSPSISTDRGQAPADRRRLRATAECRSGCADGRNHLSFRLWKQPARSAHPLITRGPPRGEELPRPLSDAFRTGHRTRAFHRRADKLTNPCSSGHPGNAGPGSVPSCRRARCSRDGYRDPREVRRAVDFRADDARRCGESGASGTPPEGRGRPAHRADRRASVDTEETAATSAPLDRQCPRSSYSPVSETPGCRGNAARRDAARPSERIDVTVSDVGANTA